MKELTTKAQNLFLTADKATKFFDGFDNFVSRVGLNNNNSLSAGYYVFNFITRQRAQLEAAYRGSWIVGRVIDSRAEDMTRAGIDITTNDDEAEIKDIQNAISRYQVWKSICSGIKWGRLYGGAIGVIQIEGQALESPLDLDTVGEDTFQGLAIFDRWQLNPNLFDVIDSGPELGLPKFYQIVSTASNGEAIAPSLTGMINVHHSRVIRFTGIELPFYQAITEMMWGESILERLWDRLISFDTATMSSANLIERANNRTVSIAGLREILAAGGKAQQGLEAQFAMMREFQTNEGMTLLDTEDEFTTTQYTFAGLSDMMIQFGQQLSGAAETPMVVLFAQSPAGMNASGDADIRMYYDSINSKQNADLRPGLELILKVMWRSVYGRPAPDDMEFTFVPLWQMSAKEKAEIAKSNTETIALAEEHGLVSRPTAMKELRDMSGDTGLFSNITDEEIEEAELEPPPLPDQEPDLLEPTGDADFKEGDHPRKNDGKFGAGGSGGSSGSSSEKFEAAKSKMKQLLKEAKRAKSRADTAPDRADKNPKSLQLANEKIAAYNKAAEEYNALLDERKGKTGDSLTEKFKKWLKRKR